ncbi:M23 family metallopeptidase [Bartonella tamiae]|nr:M23 family metallopeptidase [Bartonella tamiae]
MYFKVKSKFSRRYLQSAAVIVIAGLVAGCSSGTQRFTDSFYTGATPNQQQASNGQLAYPQAPQTNAIVQSNDLPPVAGQGSYPQQYDPQSAYPQAPSNTNYQQPTQVASAGQAMGQGQQTLGTMPASTTQISAKSGTYVVQSGDTLYSVSRKTGASVNSISTANGLTNGGIRVGQSLIIPHGNNNTVAMTNPNTQTQGTTPVQQPTTQLSAKKVAPVNAVETTPVKPTSQPAVAKAQDTTLNQVENVAVVAPQATGIAKMRWPAQGRILSSFGHKEGTNTNEGIDIMVPEGSSVKAAENGVVIYADSGLKDYGNTVLIRHEDNIVTVYGYNSQLLVKKGQKVRRGDEIAKSGMSGIASTPRVHFEVRKNSTPVNPMNYLDN